jgi:hypothetical protein
MQQLTALINELESKIPFFEKQAPAVSAASVGWHIQHTLLVSFSIIKATENSSPGNYQWKFNLSKTFVFAMNKIPRGKAKAPKFTMPAEVITADKLKSDIQVLKEKIKVLPTLQPNNFFEHPYFGHLNLKGTMKMLKLHTQHHLSIINDIIRAE